MASPTPERQDPGGPFQNGQSHSTWLAQLLWALLSLCATPDLAPCE
nr:hypothetical protein [Gloeocapsopsis dulcis]